MVKDRYDRLLWFLLVLTLTALVTLLTARGDARPGEARPAGLDKALEREMSYQARVALLQKLYGPIEELRTRGQAQPALLKLDELIRRYPGEPHGHILKGEIQGEMGAMEEAAASYTAGVRMNGDYVDDRSPLSRRTEIRQLVNEGLPEVGKRARANPDNPSLTLAMRNLYYLQSRLAGGCE